MRKAKIRNLLFFDEFLKVIGRFVSQCQFVLSAKELNVYCRNPDSYQTSRLLLKTNAMYLVDCDENDDFICEVCIKDVPALKSALGLIVQIEDETEAVVSIDTVKEDENKETGLQIAYKGAKGYKFKIKAGNYDIMKNFISKDSTTVLQHDWEFKIDPKLLSLAQNKVSSIVKFEDINVSFCKSEENGNVLVSLENDSNKALNALEIPVSESSEGDFDSVFEDSTAKLASKKKICIHESSFRIFNILSVEDSLDCFYNKKYKTFFIASSKEDDTGLFIKSRMFAQSVKAKS